MDEEESPYMVATLKVMGNYVISSPWMLSENSRALDLATFAWQKKN